MDGERKVLSLRCGELTHPSNSKPRKQGLESCCTIQGVFFDTCCHRPFTARSPREVLPTAHRGS